MWCIYVQHLISALRMLKMMLMIITEPARRSSGLRLTVQFFSLLLRNSIRPILSATHSPAKLSFRRSYSTGDFSSATTLPWHVPAAAPPVTAWTQQTTHSDKTQRTQVLGIPTYNLQPQPDISRSCRTMNTGPVYCIIRCASLLHCERRYQIIRLDNRGKCV